jgi:hypothetical protein
MPRGQAGSKPLLRKSRDKAKVEVAVLSSPSAGCLGKRGREAPCGKVKAPLLPPTSKVPKRRFDSPMKSAT